MGQPAHIFILPEKTTKQAFADAGEWVSHVKSCHLCLQRLLGINRSNAVDFYFKEPEFQMDAVTAKINMKEQILPAHPLYDTLLEVLICYYMVHVK